MDITQSSLEAVSLPESDGQYDMFLKGLDLISVGLRKCSASLDRAGLSELWEKQKAQRGFEDTYRVTRIGDGFFEAAGSFVVTVRETPKSNPVTIVECEFEAHLHGEVLSQAFIERFVLSEFQLILVPYARQFVSSITAQMSIPPLVIPLSISSSQKSATTPKKRKVPHAKTR